MHFLGALTSDGKGLIAVDRSEREGCVYGRARSPQWVVTLLLLHLLHSFASWTIFANPVCQTPLPYYFPALFATLLLHSIAAILCRHSGAAGLWQSFAFSCHTLLHSFAKLFCILVRDSLARLFCCAPLQYSFAAVLRNLSSLLHSVAHFCHTLCHTRLLQSLALLCHTLLQSSIFFYRILSPHFCHTPCCSLFAHFRHTLLL
jgi:hypothetical protein